MSFPPLILGTMILAIVSYSSAFIHLLGCIKQKKHPKQLLTLAFLLFGLLLHSWLIAPKIHGTSGLNFNLFNMLSFTSWLLLIFTVMLSTYRPILVLSLPAIPLAIIGLVLGEFAHAPYTPIPIASMGLKIHILLSLFAYCVFFMASIHSVLLWFQNRELKHKTKYKMWVDVLPPLQTMEAVLFDMIFIGFSLLTVALALGVVYVDNLFAQHLIHKTVFSAISWLIFGVLIIGRIKLGWRGKRAITFTLWGFALLFLGFLGSKFVLELVLGKGV